MPVFFNHAGNFIGGKPKPFAAKMAGHAKRVHAPFFQLAAWHRSLDFKRLMASGFERFDPCFQGQFVLGEANLHGFGSFDSDDVNHFDLSFP
jgi:hypothetical protein